MRKWATAVPFYYNTRQAHISIYYNFKIHHLQRCKMRSSKYLISVLSSVEIFLKEVVFVIPFRAATICGPSNFTGIPGLLAIALATKR